LFTPRFWTVSRAIGRSVQAGDADPQSSAAAWASGGKLPVEVEAVPLTAEGTRATQVWLSCVLAIGADIVMVDLPPAVTLSFEGVCFNLGAS
jgi:hypothetical protein